MVIGMSRLAVRKKRDPFVNYFSRIPETKVDQAGSICTALQSVCRICNVIAGKQFDHNQGGLKLVIIKSQLGHMCWYSTTHFWKHLEVERISTLLCCCGVSGISSCRLWSSGVLTLVAKDSTNNWKDMVAAGTGTSERK